MNATKKLAAAAAACLALASALAAWIFLPWTVLLAILALLALWLGLTRGGRQALAIAGVGIASLPQRLGDSSVIVVGIAGVVAVLVAMLAMAAGFGATLKNTGSEETAIVIRGGSQTETNSAITRDQVHLIAALEGIARDGHGRPMVSPELSQVVTLPTIAGGTDANVQLRGVGPDGWELRPEVRIVAGRRFAPGLRELVVGQGAMQQFRGLAVGRQVELGNGLWTVTGEFASGDAHDSELWADAGVVASTFGQDAMQSVTVKLAPGDGMQRLTSALAADPRLRLDVLTTADYYGQQADWTTGLIEIFGKVIGAIMALGAIFGALNTMYAAVAGRAREIATLRALGFRAMPLVTAVMLEAMLLAALGGILGAAVAWILFNGYTVSTLGGDFSQVVFAFQVSPPILLQGLKWALGIGFVGGLFPAMRAARLPVVEALRAV